MLEKDDTPLDQCYLSNDKVFLHTIPRQRCTLKVHVCHKIISNDGQVKSFVDDLIKERGTVSMRVAFVLRSAEVLPLFL